MSINSYIPGEIIALLDNLHVTITKNNNIETFVWNYKIGKYIQQGVLIIEDDRNIVNITTNDYIIKANNNTFSFEYKGTAEKLDVVFSDISKLVTHYVDDFMFDIYHTNSIVVFDMDCEERIFNYYGVRPKNHNLFESCGIYYNPDTRQFGRFGVGYESYITIPQDYNNITHYSRKERTVVTDYYNFSY